MPRVVTSRVEGRTTLRSDVVLEVFDRHGFTERRVAEKYVITFQQLPVLDHLKVLGGDASWVVHLVCDVLDEDVIALARVVQVVRLLEAFPVLVSHLIRMRPVVAHVTSSDQLISHLTIVVSHKVIKLEKHTQNIDPILHEVGVYNFLA